MCDRCIDGSSPTVKVNLHVTITLSKDVSVNVVDYELCVDCTEDGDFCYSHLADTDFKEAVLEQVDIPMPKEWTVEELEIERL